MTDVRAALTQAAARLAAVSDTARLDAEILMAHALGVARNDVLLDAARFAVPAGFAALVERRMAHEPVAYIVGYRDFWTVRIGVGPGSLVPRADSETLLVAATAHFGKGAPRAILDLGTGPGTLLLAALDQWPSARGVGVDASDAALDYARANAAALGMDMRAAFQRGNWGDGIDGVFDLILCNPPYIAGGEVLMPDVALFEPETALRAGLDGLDDYRTILPQLDRLLHPDGIALVEIGWKQASAVSDLARQAGLACIVHQDIGGRDRAIALRRSGGFNGNQ